MMIWRMAMGLWVLAGGVVGAEVTFKRDVQPVLKAKCVKCHGFLVRQKGLRLSSVKLILKGGESGPAAVVGKPAESLMVKAWGHPANDVKRMPPVAEGKDLTEAEKKLIEAWILGGMK